MAHPDADFNFGQHLSNSAGMDLDGSGESFPSDSSIDSPADSSTSQVLHHPKSTYDFGGVFPSSDRSGGGPISFYVFGVLILCLWVILICYLSDHLWICRRSPRFTSSTTMIHRRGFGSTALLGSMTSSSSSSTSSATSQNEKSPESQFHCAIEDVQAIASNERNWFLHRYLTRPNTTTQSRCVSSDDSSTHSLEQSIGVSPMAVLSTISESRFPGRAFRIS